MNDLDEDDKFWATADTAAYEFGKACALARDSNKHPGLVPLDHMINTLLEVLAAGQCALDQDLCQLRV